MYGTGQQEHAAGDIISSGGGLPFLLFAVVVRAFRGEVKGLGRGEELLLLQCEKVLGLLLPWHANAPYWTMLVMTYMFEGGGGAAAMPCTCTTPYFTTPRMLCTVVRHARATPCYVMCGGAVAALDVARMRCWSPISCHAVHYAIPSIVCTAS